MILTQQWIDFNLELIKKEFTTYLSEYIPFDFPYSDGHYDFEHYQKARHLFECYFSENVRQHVLRDYIHSIEDIKRNNLKVVQQYHNNFIIPFEITEEKRFFHFSENEIMMIKTYMQDFIYFLSKKQIYLHLGKDMFCDIEVTYEPQAKQLQFHTIILLLEGGE